jgi:hypothetical protein
MDRHKKLAQPHKKTTCTKPHRDPGNGGGQNSTSSIVSQKYRKQKNKKHKIMTSNQKSGKL